MVILSKNSKYLKSSKTRIQNKSHPANATIIIAAKSNLEVFFIVDNS